jgi:uncharacterized protein
MTETPSTAHRLGLVPHPEGGWYRRRYTSPVTVEHPAPGSTRPTATLIHYLLLPGEKSRWHTVGSDEIWLWQRGGRLNLVTTEPGSGPGAEPGPDPDSRTERHYLLGPDIEHGEQLHAHVPARHWQRAEPADDAEVLLACLVTPGFDFADFTLLGPDDQA